MYSVYERLFDVVALALLALVTADSWWLRSVMTILLLASGLAGLIFWMVARAIGVSDRALAAVRRTDILKDDSCCR